MNNTPAVSMDNPEAMLQAYNKLKQRYNELSNENQQLCQENYDLKRNLQAANQTNSFLSTEVESVVSEWRGKMESERATVSKLAAELQSEKTRSKLEIEGLEEHCARMRKRIEKLEQDLKQAEEYDGAVQSGPTALHSDSLQMENLELLEEVESLKETLERVNLCLQQANGEIARLTNDNTETSERYSSLRCNYESKKQEVEELNTLLEVAQEQAALLTAEITSMRANPDNDLNKKGNSLFAEVDDQRKKLMSIISTVKQRYNELKTEHRNCPAKIRQLKNMNDSLSRDLLPYVSMFRQAENRFREALLEQINDVSTQLQKTTERNKYLEQQLRGQSAEWVSSLTSYYKAQTDSLEARLKVFQLKHRLAEEDHWLAKKDLCKWRMEALHLQQMKCIQQLQKLDESDAAEECNGDSVMIKTEMDQKGYQAVRQEVVPLVAAVVKAEPDAFDLSCIKKELSSEGESFEEIECSVKIISNTKAENLSDQSLEADLPVDDKETTTKSAIRIAKSPEISVWASALLSGPNVDGVDKENETIAEQISNQKVASNTQTIKSGAVIIKRFKIGSKMQESGNVNV
ncbi:protein Spindly [Anopheles bellator]|uniref:protein Spindly n=1 Tax=Anopheles bellator TaxID=139047 RepID=UPI002649E5D5|nr:protein Spindly [Anopheles bellator]